MQRHLMILEVSQKQAYIFGSRKLSDNIRRSEEIRFVTNDGIDYRNRGGDDKDWASADFFQLACPEGYCGKTNFVYAGGGHTVLQFDGLEAARHFARQLTERVLRDFPAMELFVKICPYDPAKTPEENLTALSAALEEKKARRQASFRRKSFGVEHPQQRFRPSRDYQIPPLSVQVPQGWTLTTDGEQLAGEDNYLAVVHLDGNAMGKRVQAIYQECQGDWEKCVNTLQDFSRAINRDFAAAYDAMTADLVQALERTGYPAAKAGGKKVLPVRKVVGAGDDVCFIAAGSLGLECAVRFLEHLARQEGLDGNGYAACAGVVLIHKKYPFRQAYDLSEELCSNAKKFGAALDPDSSVSALDWHIEFGQLKGALSQIRADYRTEDGGRMELRPLVVLPGRAQDYPLERGYGFFRGVSRYLEQEKQALPRSKIKQLRTAFRQGELETRLALRQTEAGELLWAGVERRFPDYTRRALAGEAPARDAFVTDNSDPEKPVRRCLYFDAIELIDHMTFWREEER